MVFFKKKIEYILPTIEELEHHRIFCSKLHYCCKLCLGLEKHEKEDLERLVKHMKSEK